jgi:hypothetical protein
MAVSTQVTVGTTPTLLVPANIADQSAYIHAGSSDVFIGGPNVSTTNGYLMDHKDKLSVGVGDHEGLYAVVTSGTSLVYVLYQVN